MRILLILFIVLPLLEIALLIKIGGIIGAPLTIVCVVMTAFLGLLLLRQQGPNTMRRAQQKLTTGQVPAKEMVEGVFLAIGGALLLTPGFVTDFFGFCCLVPGIRQVILGFGLKHFQMKVMKSQGFGPTFEADSHTIEGEFTREENKKK